jgi:transcriptional regulator with XRE-family HTH domain
MTPHANAFGNRLLSQLLARGISQADLARRMRVSPQAVSRWITNPDIEPRYGTVKQIADAVGCDPSVLDPRLTVDSRRLRGDALAGVPGLFVAYLMTAIRALARARDAICRLNPLESRAEAHGKDDSSRVDVVAEHSIIATLTSFDKRAAVLSEERGAVVPDREYARMLTWCTDPLDRSRALHDVLKTSSAATLGDLFVDETLPLTGADAALGAVSAIVMGEVLFSCLLDYATGTLYVAFPGLVVQCPVTAARTPDELALNGEPLGFADDGNAEGLVTFLGDPAEKRHEQRKAIFAGLGFRRHHLPRATSATPGGPARVLRMCNDPDINGRAQAAMVVATGERFGEWVHWLPFCSHSRVLAVYELWCREFHGEVLVAPPPGYSILQGEGQSGVRIDIDRLMSAPTPHHYRGGIALARMGSADDAFLMALPNHRRIGSGG